MKFLAAFLLLVSAAQAELLFIYGEGCPPCERMKPIVAQLKAEGYAITAVNASRQQVPQYDGRGVPQFVVTDGNNAVLNRTVGACSADQLRKFYSAQVGKKSAGNLIDVPACRIISPCGVTDDGGVMHDYGSGVVIGEDDSASYVLTNWHVTRDRKGEPKVAFVGGKVYQGTIVRTDEALDLSLIRIAKLEMQPVAIAAAKPQVGQTLIAGGFGGEGEWRSVAGPVVMYVNGTGQGFDTIQMQGRTRDGDSGGPILNEQGEYVGTLWGSAPDGVYGTQVTKVVEFCGLCDVICGPRRWRGGRTVVEPPRQQPQQQQWQPAPQQRPPQMPIVRPPIQQQPPQQPDDYTAPPADEPADDKSCQCDCDCKCEPIDYALLSEQLAERMASDARFRPSKGDRGPAGEIDYDRLAIAVAAKLGDVGCKCENTPAPQPQDEQHVVVVADQNSPYWQRLAEQVNATKKTYHGVQVAPLPDFPIGQHPQLVIYKNSVPVRIVKGQYEVEALLSRLARGEPV